MAKDFKIYGSLKRCHECTNKYLVNFLLNDCSKTTVKYVAHFSAVLIYRFKIYGSLNRCHECTNKYLVNLYQMTVARLP